jgi:hypothetical protein
MGFQRDIPGCTINRFALLARAVAADALSPRCHHMPSSALRRPAPASSRLRRQKQKGEALRIDPFKLAHWMNVRKCTAAQAAELAGLPSTRLGVLLDDGAGDAEPDEVAAIASALRIEPAQLAAAAGRDLTIVHQTADALHATRRPIQRDGINFYNYYTMATPPGRVAPVILDILCPAGRLPALNNGHLEPAITVNLGPGDINGRWGEELTPQTWQVLAANTAPDRWITGDSYIEPSYCRHTYALASPQPARIVSYTAQASIAPLVDEVNTWSDEAFERCVAILGDGLPTGTLLDLLLARRGYDRSTAATAAGLTPTQVAGALEGTVGPGDLETLRRLARELGFDYRVLLPAERRHDEVGKTIATVEEARASMRHFGTYQVASMASAPHLPDLVGTFVLVDQNRHGPGSDLVDFADSHYLVVDGTLTLESLDEPDHAAVELTVDSSAWLAPFVRHRFSGRGAVLKFGSGAHIGSPDWLELTSTFAPAATLRSSRRHLGDWGYDR